MFQIEKHIHKRLKVEALTQDKTLKGLASELIAFPAAGEVEAAHLLGPMPLDWKPVQILVPKEIKLLAAQNEVAIWKLLQSRIALKLSDGSAKAVIHEDPSGNSG